MIDNLLKIEFHPMSCFVFNMRDITVHVFFFKKYVDQAYMIS